MAGGRPPKLFTSEEAHELGKDLVNWVESNEGKATLIWVDWYWDKHKMFRPDWKSLIQRPEFLPYYQLARQKLTRNIVLNDNIPQSYGNRYLHLYDDEVFDHEEGIRDRDAIRGTEQRKNINAEQLQVLADCLSRFSKKQQISEDTIVAENHSE